LNPYTVLEIKTGATKAEITSAYRRLSKLYHPDLNPDNPIAEEQMKRINQAYAMLSTTSLTERVAASTRVDDVKRAKQVMELYFTSIQSGNFQKAFELVSNFDKQYVTFQSFKDWRESVNRLFKVKSFTVTLSQETSNLTLRKGLHAEGKTFAVSISELNRATGEVDRYPATKHCIYERGEWRVLLGYRDLNEIARVFETISAQQETTEMQKHWEEYCRNNCRELGILSKAGFQKEYEREVYRAKRTKQPLVIAIFKMNIGDEIHNSILERAAQQVKTVIRLTDVCGYLGGGVFGVLYTDLKKRKISAATKRVTAKLNLLAETSVVCEVFSDKSNLSNLLSQFGLSNSKLSV